MIGLNRVHRQRIALAVQAWREGVEVSLVSRAAFDGFGNHWIVWRRDGKNMVIAAATKGTIDVLLPLVKAEFSRQLVEAAEAAAATA